MEETAICIGVRKAKTAMEAARMSRDRLRRPVLLARLWGGHAPAAKRSE